MFLQTSSGPSSRGQNYLLGGDMVIGAPLKAWPTLTVGSWRAVLPREPYPLRADPRPAASAVRARKVERRGRTRSPPCAPIRRSPTGTRTRGRGGTPGQWLRPQPADCGWGGCGSICSRGRVAMLSKTVRTSGIRAELWNARERISAPLLPADDAHGAYIANPSLRTDAVRSGSTLVRGALRACVLRAGHLAARDATQFRGLRSYEPHSNKASGLERCRSKTNHTPSSRSRPRSRRPPTSATRVTD